MWKIFGGVWFFFILVIYGLWMLNFRYSRQRFSPVLWNFSSCSGYLLNIDIWNTMLGIWNCFHNFLLLLTLSKKFAVTCKAKTFSFHMFDMQPSKKKVCLISYFLKKNKKLDTVFHHLPIFTNFREIIQKVALLIKAAEVLYWIKKN